MNQNDLKKYSVIVGEGSGCVFQPMTLDYTYIITAKHLFYDELDNSRGIKESVEKKNNSVINIDFQIENQDTWEEKTLPFTIIKGETYFPHEYADIAILKINPPLPGFGFITVDEQFIHEEGFELCGFPNNLRMNDKGERWRSLKIEKFTDSGNYTHHAQLFPTFNKENIEGMSGCGILKITGEHISVIGIQSKMITKKLPAGQIGFVPIKYAKQIITYTCYSGKLEPLLPIHLKSFSFLAADIFQIKPGIIQKETVSLLTTILKTEANRIINSKITPQVIKEHLTDNMLLIFQKQKNTDLEKKKIWIKWLELLTILNIAKSKSHTYEDLPSIFSKVRLFFSDCNEDFWCNHLDDLPKLDYSGLEKEGCVIVASNCEAIGNAHILDLSKIPTDIYKLRQEYTIQCLSIDNPKEFPFDNYKFLNISAFKEDVILNKAEQFIGLDVPKCVIKLKELYELLIKY